MLSLCSKFFQHAYIISAPLHPSRSQCDPDYYPTLVSTDPFSTLMCTLVKLWPNSPTDMHHCAKNVLINFTILVTLIKLYTKMFLIS